ncbi:MAG: hypothetical protein WDN45_04510 [Caulobacteraceae bacterium]
MKAERDGLTVRVPPLGSGRCTPTRRMMTMAVDKGAGGVTLLVAVNGNPECRASGGPDDIRWTYAELGLKAGDPFRFANPLVAEPGSMQPATGAALDKRLCQKLQVVAEAPQGEGAVRLLGPRGAIDIEAQPLVAPGEITSAEAGVDATGVTVVRFSIAQPAAARVLAWTSTHRGGRMATLLDGRVIQENEVGAPMGGNGLQVNAVDRARRFRSPPASSPARARVGTQ